MTRFLFTLIFIPVSKEIVTIREAAKLRNVRTGTIYNWILRGHLQRHTITTPVGDFAGVDRDELIAYQPRRAGRPKLYDFPSVSVSVHEPSL